MCDNADKRQNARNSRRKNSPPSLALSSLESPINLEALDSI